MDMSWVIIQGFDWSSLSSRSSLYSKLASSASAISKAGINAVWFPPPSQSVDLQGYLPQEWYKLEAESNQLSAISSVKSSGMSAIADVVVNHRTAPAKDACLNQYTAFKNPDMGNWAVTRDDENCAGKADQCGCGAYDTGEVVTYSADLDHTNSGVRGLVKDYLSFLKKKGYSGWRFDLVKGYSASYVGEYVSASSPNFAVGEYFDGSTSKVTGWIKGTGSLSQAFDFPLRYTLRDAIKYNNYGSLGAYMPGVAGQDPSHAVPFLDNHDTSRDDRFGSTDQLAMGYAYILTHPGTPCVFWTDWGISSLQNSIKLMITARRAGGVTATSSLYVERHEGGLYAAYVNNGRLAVKLGTTSWAPDSNYQLSTSGNNYAIWTKK